MATRIRRTPEQIAREWIQAYPAVARLCALDAKAGRLIDLEKNPTAKRWVIANADVALKMAEEVMIARYPHLFANGIGTPVVNASTRSDGEPWLAGMECRNDTAECESAIVNTFANDVPTPVATATVSAPAIAPASARRMVLDAFARLDREGYNQVGIAAIADETGLPLPTLHAAIHGLRWENVLTASALEGRHGITQRERETAIHEHGDMLGYLSRCN